MQTDAGVVAVMEGGGGQRVFNTGHGAVVVDGGAAGAACKLMEQQRKEKERAFHDHQPRIGTVSQLIAGGVAGAVGKTCTAPLARLTILFQLQGMHTDAANLKSASIWRETTRIIKEEGYRAFWRGNLVTIAHRIPYSSVSFYAFERYKNLLQLVLGVESPGENISKDLSVRLVGGGLAGITAASVTYPLDLVRTRLAAQTNVIYYRGIWHALRTISREEGANGLYKGLGATLLGVGPSLAISFAVYETARTYWQFHRPDDSTVLIGLGCGSLSGIASSTGSQVIMVSSSLDPARHQVVQIQDGSSETLRSQLEGTPLYDPGDPVNGRDVNMEEEVVVQESEQHRTLAVGDTAMASLASP